MGESSNKYQGNTSVVFFLNTFHVPRQISEYVILTVEEWTLLLGKSPQIITAELMEQGYLQKASLYEHLDFKYTVGQLKAFLKERNLGIQGKKKDLIIRLIRNDLRGAQESVSEISLIVCSTKGQDLVNDTLGRLSNESISKFQEIASITPQKFRDIMTFTLGSVIGGTIGNRSDALFVSLYNWVRETISSSKATRVQSNESNLVSVPTNMLNSLSKDAIVLLLSVFGSPRKDARFVMISKNKEEGLIFLLSKYQLEVIEELHSRNLFVLDYSMSEYLRLLRKILEPNDIPPVSNAPKTEYRLTRRLSPEEEEILNNGYRITDEGENVANLIMKIAMESLM